MPGFFQRYKMFFRSAHPKFRRIPFIANRLRPFFDYQDFIQTTLEISTAQNLPKLRDGKTGR